MFRKKSLSELIEKLGKNQWEFFESNNYRDKEFSAKTVNPIPEFINQRKRWSLFGIFVGYMIMKFFKDKLISPKARIVSSVPLAEISIINLRKIIKSEEVLVIKDNVIPTHEIESLLKQADKWLKGYKEESWEESIIDNWLLSHLDQFYRFHQYPVLTTFSKSEEQSVQAFLKQLITWLEKEFDSAKEVFLNPKLGIPNIIRADIDLIIDGVLWDIKTTKYPEKAPNFEINFLFACSSLVHYHNQDEERFFPSIDSIGFLFTQQLTLWKKNIKEYSYRKREEVITKLIKLAKENL
ncbi:MAG: hypothetical protein FK732_07585 [Asgard group archaeon]|nr:hypothetical protein [Asgard group archaeon]